jgi:Tfp pilus assembly protein PilW
MRSAPAGGDGHARGLTVVELLVGLGLALAALAGASALLEATRAALHRAGRRAELARAVGDAVDQLARDVRVAGYDPRATGIVALATAAPSQLVLHADLDGDGTIDSASAEVIGWRLTGAGTLQRALGAQTMPIVSHVPAGGFALRYLDGDGAALDPTSPETPRRARVIAVELTARDPSTGHAVSVAGGARVLNAGTP